MLNDGWFFKPWVMPSQWLFGKWLNWTNLDDLMLKMKLRRCRGPQTGYPMVVCHDYISFPLKIGYRVASFSPLLNGNFGLMPFLEKTMPIRVNPNWWIHPYFSEKFTMPFSVAIRKDSYSIRPIASNKLGWKHWRRFGASNLADQAFGWLCDCNYWSNGERYCKIILRYLWSGITNYI